MRSVLLTAAFALGLAGCAVPPQSAYVSGGGRTEVGGQALGNNAAGEACTQQIRGEGKARAADVYCGTWQQPSGSVRSAGPLAAADLLGIATASPWRQGLDQRYACDAPRMGTVLGNVPAAVLSCTRRQGGWPQVALVAAAGGGASGQDAWYADGVLPALPAIERSIGLQSGRLAAAAAAAQTSGADALLASRLAAQAFSSGDIGQFDTLMTAGSRANQAERFAAAETAFRAALALQRKAVGNNNPNTATTIERLALQISNQGRYAESDTLFAQAAALAGRSDDPLATARLNHYEALNLLNQGKIEPALAQLDLAEAGYVTRIPPPLLNARPIRLASTSGFGDALANRELVADPTTRAAVIGAVEVRRYRAVVLRALGRTAEADQALQSASTLAAGNLREPVEQGRLTRTAGAADMLRGDQAGAVSEFNAAASTFTLSLPRSRPLAETRLLEAAAIGSAEGLNAALDACRDGTQILRQESLGVPPEVIGPCLDIFAKAAAALPARSQELLAAMFEAAQLGQGGVTGSQIAQATARLAEGARDPKVADAIRKRQDAESTLAGLDRERDVRAQAASGGAAGDVAAAAALDTKLAAARAALAEADAALQSASPNYGQLVQEVVPASAIFALLRPEEAFVAVDVGTTGGWVFALRDGQVTAAPLPLSLPAVTKLVQRVRAGVEPTTDALPRFDTQAASELYTATLGGVGPKIAGAKSLVIAPTGPLLSIPFGMLLTGPGDPDHLAAAPWLLRRVTIAHVPAAANFVSLRKIAGGSRATKPWFGFGDFHPVTLAQAQRSFPGNDCADSAKLFAGLPPLPLAGKELEAARLLLGGDKADELLGSAFTAKAVMATPLKNYRILHFATHALLPAELRCQSEAAIVTSDPAGAGDASGALLTVSNVVGLDLDADTVILSACNSGGGAVSASDPSGAGKVAGESLSGLARAFFYAGARSLMVTHWSVNDQAAAFLVADTMQKVKQGAGIADALRAAQLGWIDSATGPTASLAHPLYWAPFALIGDGGAGRVSSAALRGPASLQLASGL